MEDLDNNEGHRIMAVSGPTSFAVHHRKSSILSLPAEIRNRVYELLFVSASHIYCVDEGTYLPGIPLLSTCRQIHFESSIYSNSCHRIKEMCNWLERIGGSSRSIRSIIIEMPENECPGIRDRSINQTDIDLLPILRYVWAQDTNRASIELELLPKSSDSDQRRKKRRLVMAGLVADRAIELSKYSKFPRLLRSVDIDIDAPEVRVQFLRTERLLRDGYSFVRRRRTATEYVYGLEGDKLVQIMGEYEKAPLLQKLFYHEEIVDSLLQSFFADGLHLTYNLSNHTVQGGPRNIFGANQYIRNCLYSQIIKSSGIRNTLMAVSDGPKFAFTGELDSNDYWLRCARMTMASDVHSWFDRFSSVTLRFALEEELGLADVRFDATRLVQLLSNRTFRYLLTIIIQIYQSQSIIAEAASDLDDLKDRIASSKELLLSKKPNGVDPARLTAWADGLGMIREMGDEAV